MSVMASSYYIIAFVTISHYNKNNSAALVSHEKDLYKEHAKVGNLDQDHFDIKYTCNLPPAIKYNSNMK